MPHLNNIKYKYIDGFYNIIYNTIFLQDFPTLLRYAISPSNHSLKDASTVKYDIAVCRTY